MKKIILLLALTIFCFAQDKYQDDFVKSFDSEYNENKIEVFHIENLIENLINQKVVPYLLKPEILKEERVFLTIINGR